MVTAMMMLVLTVSQIFTVTEVVISDGRMAMLRS